MGYLVCDTCCGELSKEIAVSKDIFAALQFIYESGYRNPYPYEQLVIVPIDDDRCDKLLNKSKLEVV